MKIVGQINHKTLRSLLTEWVLKCVYELKSNTPGMKPEDEWHNRAHNIKLTALNKAWNSLLVKLF
jgi:hypothetical protein